MEQRTNKKLITFSDRNLDMIEAISKETGWDTPTQVVRRGIEELYKQTFKYGKEPSSENEAPEDRAERKANEKKLLKEAEEKAKLQPKIDMCLNTLKGEIETNEGGFKFCRFTSYGRTPAEDKSQLIPIKQVDPILLDTMIFSPTKEAVFKNRSDIKKLFSR